MTSILSHCDSSPLELSSSTNSLSSSNFWPPPPPTIYEDSESHAGGDFPPLFTMTDGKIIHWPTVRRYTRRKGPWYPSQHYITLKACEIATRAAATMPLDRLYRAVLDEWSEVRVARRPALDDGKVFFYEMVLEQVEELLAMEEGRSDAARVNRSEHGGESSYYSSSSDSDTQVSEIDWDMIRAASVAAQAGDQMGEQENTNK
ncbi:hypothetical protein B0T16DRAFT_457025 [Cercophora newfieldiana]|uniref:Uncharacterized protein n=1 Tax=Cercophora newfieldiana TaxID=92897 RepID=A0AA39YCY6_9PEZI|nr:hypothetical protein B0T16DRAFT_457025 [Cercophora newfieldiana]